MARNNRQQKPSGPTKLQIAYLILSAIIVLSMVLSILPMTQ